MEGVRLKLTKIIILKYLKTAPYGCNISSLLFFSSVSCIRNMPNNLNRYICVVIDNTQQYLVTT